MKIWVIGGWASGMMAVTTLVEMWIKDQVFLFEKNSRIWVKVLITWGGRCNVTNWIFSLKDLLLKYPRGAEFIKKWMKLFWPKQMIQWLAKHWLETKVEKDNRVFPITDKSKDVVGVFEKIIAEHSNVQVLLGTEVMKVEKSSASLNSAPPLSKEDIMWSCDQFKIITNEQEYIVDYLILTTGGSSYVQGVYNWYEMAKALWHSITKIGPALTSFVLEDERPKTISGLSVQNARLEVFDPNIGKQTTVWPLLFTHFGMSWPAAFYMSSLLAREDFDESNPLACNIKLDNDKNFEFYDAFLLEKVQNNQHQNIITIISELFPRKLMEEVLMIAGINNDIKIWEVRKEDRKILAHLLSGELEVKIIWRRPGEEFVSAGWVNTDEIDPATMQSKICPHLYLCGEALNVDWLTGWFNLQNAWMTGRVAGLDIGKRTIGGRTIGK